MTVVSFRELCRKEVVCTCDGARLGNICDLEADLDSGCILSFFVPDGRGFSFKKKSFYRIDRCQIEKIGKDFILVRNYSKTGKCGE